MSDQTLPDGTYRVRGPGGLLTMVDRGAPVWMAEGGGDPTQLWDLRCAGAVTLRSLATGLYLGSDGDPNEPQMMVRGSGRPFEWTLSEGDDDDERTHILTSAASSDGLVLTLSLLRIFPPHVAILPPSYRPFEWAFDRVE
jgi:hypothetical protein